MEGAAVEQDEVSCLRVDLHVVGEFLLLLLLVREQTPVLLAGLHLLLLEELLLVVVGGGTDHEASVFVPCVGEGHDSLVAPDSLVNGGLVAVEEGVDGSFLVVPGPVHEAEAIE